MSKINKLLRDISGIYKIISPIGRTYIGKSSNIYERWKTYRKDKPLCINQPRIYNSIKKYGWRNHIFEIIVLCDKHELNELEEFYISLYDTSGTKHGLNLTSGGCSEIKCKVSLKKISIKNKGKRLGKYSSNAKRVVQYSKDGNLIKVWDSITDASKELNIRHDVISSCARRGRNLAGGFVWKFYYDEIGKKIEPYKHGLSKCVYQYSINGELIKKWDSIMHASKELKISYGNISNVCNNSGGIKKAGGFRWSFENKKLNDLIFKDFSNHKNPNCKPIYQHDINGKLIKKWGFIKEACIEHKTLHSNLWKAIKSQGTCKGFRWSYDGKINYETLNNIPINSKKVYQHDENGNVIEIWTSVKSASMVYNTGIYKSIYNNTICAGYRWSYSGHI